MMVAFRPRLDKTSEVMAAPPKLLERWKKWWLEELKLKSSQAVPVRSFSKCSVRESRFR